MKVISGKMRGMNLNTDLDRFTRPTEGKIKEAMFSVIFQVKPNSKALDLFAGSGAVGIEFISRGCDLVVFSETKITIKTYVSYILNKGGYYVQKI